MSKLDKEGLKALWGKMLDGFVTKKDGKGLSTNDFTNEDKEKVASAVSVDAASVGQTIIVKEVDANGKPTKWESADYQPRTHWIEYGEILPTTTVEPVDMDGQLGAEFQPACVPIHNQEYTVLYNGVEYPCLCVYDETDQMYYIADQNMINGQDISYPFIILLVQDEGYIFGAILCMEEVASVTFSIRGATSISKIPGEFLDSEWVANTVSGVVDATIAEINTKNQEQDNSIASLTRKGPGFFSITKYVDDVSETLIDTGWLTPSTSPSNVGLAYIREKSSCDISISHLTTQMETAYGVVFRCNFTIDAATLDSSYASAYCIRPLDTTELTNNAIALKVIVRKDNTVMYRLDTITI